jgi:glutamine synthetase
MLAAGLEGIQKGYKLPQPIEENVFEMSPEEREQKRIKTLPGSLYEAVQLTEKSQMVREALGDHAFSSFIQNKKVEWDRYRTHVTDYELKNYLPIL